MKPTKVTLGLVVLSILLITAVYLLKSRVPNQVVTNPSSSPSPSMPASGIISISGVALCLPHKNTQGPQTLECAYGLKDDQGNYYALSDSDPNYQNISKIEMNKEVLVEGNFKPSTSNIYPTIGVITITKITN